MTDEISTETHPRSCMHLIGHEKAENAFLDALASKRMHHAWLITGPKGIGKATLAYRMARTLLAENAGDQETTVSLFGDDAPRTSLEMSSDHPVFQRIASGGHGNLKVIERGWDEKKKALRTAITVDDIRRAHSFFANTASEEGRRVCIIDSTDDLNTNAANALLKVLEEPPENAVLLLLAHMPGKLLPTIRSRCRTLSLTPLSTAQVEGIIKDVNPALDDKDVRSLAVLADGAPGQALALMRAGGLDVFRELLGFLEMMPGLDVVQAHKRAAKLGLKSAEEQYRLFILLLLRWIEHMVKAAAGGPVPAEIVEGENAIIQRFANALPLDRWCALWEKMGRLAARADAVYLDRKQIVLNMLLMVDEAARGRMPA